jgi:RNA polymerase sigma-70 factor (ECF subfamily)
MKMPTTWCKIVLSRCTANIHNFRGNARLYTWLYRIATNEAITFLNRKKRHATTSIDDEENAMARQLQADDYFDGDQAQALLLTALSGLPEKQRIVFNLRYYDEMSYKEMSEILGTSVGALKASYHHAVKKIENHLREAPF